MSISEVRRPERVLLLEPKEMDRGGRKPIARTTCEITFSSEENLLRCVRALKESDEVLQKRPDEMKLWEWNKTYREGMKIVFGVAWYDKAFFESRKDAFKDSTHIERYREFGATVNDFVVEHEMAQ